MAASAVDSPSNGAYYGDLEVEVKSENGSYFRAFIVDIFENEVVVAYENEWTPRCKVPLADVRLPDVQHCTSLRVGDDAEVFSRVKKTEPCAYWSCRIVQQKGEFFVIEYTAANTNFVNEIVEQDRLRPPNRNPPVASKSFYKCIIELPDSLRDVCEDMSLHRDLLKACNARMIVGDKHAGTLTMLSQSEDLISRAEMLADIHVRSLPTKVLLKQRAAERVPGSTASGGRLSARSSGHEIESVDEPAAYPYMDEFTIDENLLGLAIGARGSNLSAAKAIRGVLNVDLNDSTNTFYIGGETKEAVDQARHCLEYLKVSQPIPQAFAGRMIGKGGSKMQEIVDQAAVVRASTELVNSKGDVPFVFVGRRKAVDHARLLLDYHFLLMKELDGLSTVRAREAPAQSFRRSWFPTRGGGGGDRAERGGDRGGHDDRVPPAGGNRGQRHPGQSRRGGAEHGGAAGRGGGDLENGVRPHAQASRRGGQASGHRQQAGGGREYDYDEETGYDDHRHHPPAGHAPGRASHDNSQGRGQRGDGRGRNQRQQQPQQTEQVADQSSRKPPQNKSSGNQEQLSAGDKSSSSRITQNNSAKGAQKNSRKPAGTDAPPKATMTAEQERDWGQSNSKPPAGSASGQSNSKPPAASASSQSSSKPASSSAAASSTASGTQKVRGPRNQQQQQKQQQHSKKDENVGGEGATAAAATSSSGAGRIPSKSSNHSVQSAGSAKTSPQKSTEKAANKDQSKKPHGSSANASSPAPRGSSSSADKPKDANPPSS